MHLAVWRTRLSNIYTWFYNLLPDEIINASFQHFRLGNYEVHYLIDCGAGYMTGIDKVFACSVKNAIQYYRQHNVEKVYYENEMVYSAKWS